jgi:hypothetical protein
MTRLAEARYIEGGKVGPYSTIIAGFFSSALHDRIRALGSRTGRTRLTCSRLRALDLGTTCTRARRAETLRFTALTAIQDDRLLSRNRGLEHIVAQIRYRRTLSLKHVLGQVRLSRARGYT